MATDSPPPLSLFNNTNPNNSDPNLAPSKKRKLTHPQQPARQNSPPTTNWRNQSEQQLYSSKLFSALRHLRRPDSPAANGRTVRDAADRVLAVSAQGKTRWSRAILSSKLRLKLAQVNRKHKKAAKPGLIRNRLEKEKPISVKKLQPVQKKVKALSRLVPGCRKVSLPNLLEETSDYIAALEMQVKAMTFLTALLNGGFAVPSGHHHSTSS